MLWPVFMLTHSEVLPVALSAHSIAREPFRSGRRMIGWRQRSAKTSVASPTPASPLGFQHS